MDRPKSAPDEREKVWNHLLNTAASVEIKSMNILESDVFAPQIIELRRTLAFIGLHGTGKTLLLRMLESAFGYVNPVGVPPFISGTSAVSDAGEQYSFYPPGIQGVLELEVMTPCGMVKRRVDLSKTDVTRRNIWMDALGETWSAWGMSPLFLFTELSMLFGDYDSLHELIRNDIGSDVSKAKLNALANIVGRRYNRVTVHSAYLADQTKSADIQVPYIAALLGDRMYDSSGMSQGELWVHYVLSWFLETEVRKGDLALLDEPEAFLAARAQRPFIDQVARQVLEKDLQLIIATHSPEVLARFPLDNIRMCIPSSEGIRVIKPESIVEIRDSIGIQTPIRALVLVEDRLSEDILRALFARYDRALIRECEIVRTNGEADVKGGLRILTSLERLACIGVLDGDQRGDPKLAKSDVLFLPGSSFPEDELISVANQETPWVASRLKVSAESLQAAVSTCAGLDHQYWMKALASALGLKETVIVYELVQGLLRNRRMQSEARRLVSEIRSRLR